MERFSKKIPKPHQVEAIDLGYAHFLSEASGTMVMPCGSGKTLTALWIAQRLAVRKLLVVVPTLYLQGQALDTWTADVGEFAHTTNLLLVGSGKNPKGILSTTSRKRIEEFLNASKKDHLVVFTTYSSSAIVASLVLERRVSFDMCIFDEAHRTTGLDKDTFQALLFLVKGLGKRLFMTATPRFYAEPEAGSDGTLFTMDNESLYGKVFYRLGIREAIEKGIICDYKVIALANTGDESLEKVAISGDKYSHSGLAGSGRHWAVAVSLVKAFNRYRLSKVVVFANTISASKNFTQLLGKVSATMGRKIDAWHVDTKAQSAAETRHNLFSFAEAKTGVLCNARLLIEGYDLPSVDATVFLDEKSSPVDIVQAAGRGWRISPGKQICYLMLPLFIESNTPSDRDMKNLRKVFTALAFNDSKVVSYFTEHVRYGGHHDVLFEDTRMLSMKNVFEKLLDDITITVWRNLKSAEGSTAYRPWEEAAKFTMSLSTFGVINPAKWFEYCKSEKNFPGAPKRPIDVPISLSTVYWPHYEPNVFFSGAAKKKVWVDVSTAAAFTRSLAKFGVVNSHAFQRYVRDPKSFPGAPFLPDNIPAKPWRVYGEFYRPNEFFEKVFFKGKFLSPEECAAFTNSLYVFGIKNNKDFTRYATGEMKFPGAPEKPKNVPSYLRSAYRDKYVPHLFFKGSKNRVSFTWQEVAFFTKSLAQYGVKNHVDWERYCEDPLVFPGAPDRPVGMPKVIRNVFKDVYKPSLFFESGDDIRSEKLKVALKTKLRERP
jgi:superfamily II DNA or RNA helicase